MSIAYRILGSAGRDNALFVQVDGGQSIDRLLFDCGEGCVSELATADILGIDELFFSHCHMDHVGGFDSFFRCAFQRDSKPNRIWGPPGTTRIMQHRFRGYLWNLHEQMSATWSVCDVHPGEIRKTAFELREAFAFPHDRGTHAYERTITDGGGYSVDAFTMDHRTPTLAYVVREKPRRNIDPSRLASLGLRPGPWLKQLRDAPETSASIVIEGVTHSVDALQKALFIETPGDSIAYLTDFLLDDAALDRLTDALRGCRVLVCEGQYRHADLPLASKHFHMTTVLTATLAQRAKVEELVLFHVSDRYQREGWMEMLAEARQVFPNTHYPAAWDLEIGPNSSP